MRRKKRVRMHLVSSGADLPSIEGLLLSRHNGEYLLALPSLLLAAGGNPAELEARWVRVPRERVAFYEVLS